MMNICLHIYIHTHKYIYIPKHGIRINLAPFEVLKLNKWFPWYPNPPMVDPLGENIPGNGKK